MRKFLSALWRGIKAALRQLWSLVTDHAWDADPYKLGGFAAYIVAGILAFRVFDAAAKVDNLALGILAGLVSIVAGLGTTLFSMSRQHDATLIAQVPPAGGAGS